MSMIWFDGIIELEENEKMKMKGGLIFMTLNILSIICFIVFFDSYRKNVLMQKAPCKFYIIISFLIFLIEIIFIFRQFALFQNYF
jgi:hypothetical protein